MLAATTGSTLAGAINRILLDLFLARAPDETAFALRTFPDSIPYLGPGAVIEGLLHRPFPTLNLPDVKSVWALLVDLVYGGINPSAGKGAEHYSFVPEHYMYFGVPGVIFLSLFFGWVYGLLFSWTHRLSNNPYAILFASAAMAAFLGSLIDGRMAVRLGDLAFGALLPIGIIVALSSKAKWAWAPILAPVYLTVMFYLLNRLFATRIFDYPFAVALLIAYINTFVAIKRFSEPASQTIPVNHFQNRLTGKSARLRRQPLKPPLSDV